MAKLCSKTRYLIKSSDPEISFSLEPELNDNCFDLPNNLKLPFHSTPASSEDPLVDGLVEDILSLINHMKPVSLKSNLSFLERVGLKWVLDEVNKGDLQFVKADKGGALCIIERQLMQELERYKLEDTKQFECMGEDDPIPDTLGNLLDLWRHGEVKCFVERDISYKVVGLCDSGRPSTLSLFKPGIPYFYGLLKIHKVIPDNLIPESPIPLRLVNDPVSAPQLDQINLLIGITSNHSS